MTSPFKRIVLLTGVLSLGIAHGQSALADRSVSGLVISSERDQPVGGAVVVAVPTKGAQQASVATATDIDGSFQLKLHGDLEYSVSVEKAGFFASAVGDRPGILIGANDRPATLRLRLTPAAVIAGQVRDSDNTPLIGATVQLVQTRAANGEVFASTVTQQLTNDLGEYRFHGLRPGRYYVGAFYRDARSVFGLNIDSSGRGTLSDHAVTYYPGTADPQLSRAIRVKSGQVLSGIDIHILRVPSVLIEGQIVNPPASGSVRVFLQPSDARTLGVSQSFTIDEGKRDFFFRSVPPGDYVLRAQVGSGSQPLAGRAIFTVASSSISNLQMPLGPSPVLSGRIRLENDRPLPSDLQVFLTGTLQPSRMKVQFGPAGDFQLRLPADKYSLGVFSAGNPVALKEIVVRGRSLEAAAFDLDISMDALEVVLTSSTARLEGRVDEARAETFVLAVGGDGQRRQVYFTRTGEDGGFSFAGLPVGQYSVVSFVDVESEYDLSQELLDQVRTHGEKVDLEGTTKTVRISATTANP